MMTRTLLLTFLFLGLPVAGHASGVVNDFIRIAHSAPWPIDKVEADVQALAIGPLRMRPMDKVVEPTGFADPHYWAAARRLTVSLAGAEAQGLLGCNRIGREGWETVLSQAGQPFAPLSSNAGSRFDFLSLFAHDPYPFPEDAYLYLECFTVLKPTARMPAVEMEKFLQAAAANLQEQFSIVKSEPIPSGFFEPASDGIVATGGQAFDGYRLNIANVFFDPNGALNVRVSAWATLAPS